MAKAKKYLVRAYVQGLRNGEPWPAVGEEIELTDNEAADYLRFGYVIEKDDEDELADPAEPREQQPIDEHPVHTEVIATPDGEKTPGEAKADGDLPGQNGLTTVNGPAVNAETPESNATPAEGEQAPKAPRIAKK